MEFVLFIKYFLSFQKKSKYNITYQKMVFLLIKGA